MSRTRGVASRRSTADRKPPLHILLPPRAQVASSALEDVARAMELATPAFPGAFLPLAGGAAFVRSLALVGRNSLLNGTIMRHLGAAENFADVRAKLEVQGRLLALVSLPLGLLLFRATAAAAGADVDGAGVGAEHVSALPVLAAYAGVFAGHNFTCWGAARALELPTLNRRRLALCAEAFVRARREGAGANGDAACVPTPAEVAELEGVYASRLPEGAVQIGAPLHVLAVGHAELSALAEACLASASDPTADPDGGDAADGTAEVPYIVGWDRSRGGAVGVCLPPECSPRFAREAALAAAELRASSGPSAPQAMEAGGAAVGEAVARAAAAEPAFAAALRKAGWRVEAVQLGGAPRAAVTLAEV